MTRNFFYQYLEDISGYGRVNYEEEVKLIHRAQNGDGKAFDKLVTSNLKFVIRQAKKFTNQGIELMDLISVGNIGLMKAIKRFDPDRGFKLITYAVWWINQQIKNAINNQARIIRLPMNKGAIATKIIKDLKSQDINKSEFFSVKEICDKYDLSEFELIELLNIYHLVFTNYRDEILIDAKYLADHNFLEKILESDTEKILNTKLNNLNERQRFIANKYFDLFGDSWTLEMIGEELDLTRERVRQIKVNILDVLNKIVHKSDFDTKQGLPYSIDHINEVRYSSNFNIIEELLDYENEIYKIVEEKETVENEIEESLEEELMKDLYDSL